MIRTSLFRPHRFTKSTNANELVETSWYDCSVLSVQLHIVRCIHSVEPDTIQNLKRRRNLCYTTSTDEKKSTCLEKTPLNTSTSPKISPCYKKESVELSLVNVHLTRTISLVSLGVLISLSLVGLFVLLFVLGRCGS